MLAGAMLSAFWVSHQAPAVAAEGTTSWHLPADPKYGDARITWRTGAVTRKVTVKDWRGATARSTGSDVESWRPDRLVWREGCNIDTGTLWAINAPTGTHRSNNDTRTTPRRNFRELFSQQHDLTVTLRFRWYTRPVPNAMDFTGDARFAVSLTGGRPISPTACRP